MENVNRVEDLLILNFSMGTVFIRSSCRVTTSVYNLPGHCFISIWFALRTAPSVNIYFHTLTHWEGNNIKLGQDFRRAFSHCVFCTSTSGNRRECIHRIECNTRKAGWFQAPAVSGRKKALFALKKVFWKCIGILLKPEWSILFYFRNLGCDLCFWNLAPLPIWK